MSPRVVAVTWCTPDGIELAFDVCQVVREALQLSVWRAGGVMLACCVTPTHTQLMLQVPAGYAPDSFILWVRAAAQYALARYADVQLPVWQDVYCTHWVDCDAVYREITACLPHTAIASR